MKQIILSISTVMLVLFHNEVQANPLILQESCCVDENPGKNAHFYLGAIGSANYLEAKKANEIKVNFHTGYALTGLVGYKLCNGVRFEGEYTFRKNRIDKARVDAYGTSHGFHGYIKTSSFMGNLLWDLPVEKWECNLHKFQPYVGVGIGYDYGKIAWGLHRVSGWNYSWQLMAGVAYPITDRLDASVEYKFHRMKDLYDFHNARELYDNSIGIGLKYRFGG